MVSAALQSADSLLNLNPGHRAALVKLFIYWPKPARAPACNETCYSSARRMKRLHPVRPSNGLGRISRINDSTHALPLTLYTIWCSSAQPRNESHDIPRLASRKSLEGRFVQSSRTRHHAAEIDVRQISHRGGSSQPPDFQRHEPAKVKASTGGPCTWPGRLKFSAISTVIRSR